MLIVIIIVVAVVTLVIVIVVVAIVKFAAVSVAILIPETPFAKTGVYLACLVIALYPARFAVVNPRPLA